jgi:hypothetical protein
MNDEQIQSFLDEIGDSFHTLKRQVEISVKQVDDEGFFAILDNGSNSIAVIIKHLAGNMISRWANYLTTDGEDKLLIDIGIRSLSSPLQTHVSISWQGGRPAGSLFLVPFHLYPQ